MFFDHDSESDHDFDFDSDPAGDFDGDDFDRDPDFDDPPSGGRERRDLAPVATMPMTRRDIDSLYSSALDGTRSFLNKRREQKTAGMPSPAELAIGGAEVIGGAMASAYLAQRLRQSGLVLPVGLTLGTLTLLASWFYGNKHLMFGGFGLLAGAGAMWAAGHGSLSAEGADAPDVSPNAAPFARPLSPAPVSRFAGAAFAPAPAAAPAFGGQAPLTEAQYANIFRGGT